MSEEWFCFVSVGSFWKKGRKQNVSNRAKVEEVDDSDNLEQMCNVEY